jgi:glutaredoxin-like protein
MLKDNDKKMLSTYFSQKLVNPVKLVVFSQRKSPLATPAEHTCMYCAETEELAREVASLSPKMSVEVLDFVADKEKAAQYRIDKIPAIAVVGQKDYNIRYFGIPAGYEFTPLIESVVDVSRGATALSETSKQRLKSVDKDVHIQVFVTPT